MGGLPYFRWKKTLISKAYAIVPLPCGVCRMHFLLWPSLIHPEAPGSNELCKQQYFIAFPVHWEGGTKRNWLSSEPEPDVARHCGPVDVNVGL